MFRCLRSSVIVLCQVRRRRPLSHLKFAGISRDALNAWWYARAWSAWATWKYGQTVWVVSLWLVSSCVDFRVTETDVYGMWRMRCRHQRSNASNAVTVRYKHWHCTWSLEGYIHCIHVSLWVEICRNFRFHGYIEITQNKYKKFLF